MPAVWRLLTFSALLLLLTVTFPARHSLACHSGQRQTARVNENPMSEWSQWTDCDVPCGEGKQTRWRSSIVLPQEKEHQSRPCGRPCVEIYEWTSWLEWSNCSLSCGSQGVRSRFRDCRRPGARAFAEAGELPCPGDWMQAEACNQFTCPPVFMWTPWSQWSQCTVTCGAGGMQHRSRQCQRESLEITAPDSCNGLHNETRQCNIDVLCPFVPEWQAWSPWSSCSVTCGPASITRRRERLCPSDQSIGICIQPDVATETQRRDCGNPDCPAVNGGWGAWNPWSNCFATCGWSIRTRNRLCNNPPPSNGGADCGSSSAGVEKCLGGECPVDGQWGAWSPCTHIQGSPCVTKPRDRCSEGEMMYCRDCNNPAPEFGGSPCVTGLATDKRECWNTDACDNSILQPPMNFTVVGFVNSNDLLVKWRRAPFGLPASSFYITWAISGADSDSVNKINVSVVATAQQQKLGESYSHWIRELTINSVIDITIETKSTVGGILRQSERLEQSFRVSRVDGEWGEWSSYGSCSPTGDCRKPGTHKRSRKCNNPAPINGGLPCPGSADETSRCFHPC